MPHLLPLAKRPPEALQIVVVSQDTAYAAIEEFFGGAPDPSLHLRLDQEKKLFDGFRVNTLPTAFLVVDGELRARFGGLRHWDAKPERALLERLIAEKTNP